MFRKAGVFFLLLLLFCNFVLALDSDSLQKKIRDVEDKYEQAKEFTEEDKWDYLGESWKEVLLKNRFFSAIDSFFRELNPVFVFLFGEDYNFSLTLFFVILFWVFLLSVIFFLIRDYFGVFDKAWIAFLVSVIVSSLIAHSGVYRKIAENTFKFLFFKGGFFDYVFVILFLLVLFLIWDLIRGFGKRIKAEREQIDKEQAKQDRYILHRIVKILSRSLTSEDKKIKYVFY